MGTFYSTGRGRRAQSRTRLWCAAAIALCSLTSAREYAAARDSVAAEAATAAASPKAALNKVAAEMRLRLKSELSKQDERLSKVAKLLDSQRLSLSPLAAHDKATIQNLAAKKIRLARGTKLDSWRGISWGNSDGGHDLEPVHPDHVGAYVRKERKGPGDDERQGSSLRHRSRRGSRDSSSSDHLHQMGGREKAEAEAEAFARLTAGARDPKKDAKARLAKKAAKDSYARATSERMIWKDINEAVDHAESHTVRVDRGDLQAEVHLLSTLSPAKAATELSKLSQQEGTAALGALKALEPHKVQQILDALKDKEIRKAESSAQTHSSGSSAEPAAVQNAKQGKTSEQSGSSENAQRARSHSDGGAGHAGSGAGATGAAGTKLHNHQPPPQFDITTVDRFDPAESLSYKAVPSETFSLSYADRSVLTGFVGKDIVQIGHYYALTRFGCALDCNDPHFNGVDGILGLGMPDAALPAIPTPLIFAISNDRGGIEGANYINERPLHKRKFAFLSNAVSGELQLGGYDRASTNADMVYVPTTSTTEYSVNVQSLTFGGIELLNWINKDIPNALPAIMDTGTTCLVIPDTFLDGRVSEKPYSKFKSIMTKGMSFYITIDGHLFEIPYEFWWQRINNAPCVQKTPESYAGILLGDVVFQSLVVEFDLSKPHHPMIGVAPRNPLYTPVQPGKQDSLKIPIIKRSKQGVEIVDPDDEEESDRRGIDHVPISINHHQTEYFVNVSVGSPRQTFTVLVDTGSSTFAIFSRMPPSHGNLALSTPDLDARLAEEKKQLFHKNAAMQAVERGEELERREKHKRDALRMKRAQELKHLGEHGTGLSDNSYPAAGLSSAAEAFEFKEAGDSRKEAMQLSLAFDQNRQREESSLYVMSSGSGPTGSSGWDESSGVVLLAVSGLTILMVALTALRRRPRTSTLGS